MNSALARELAAPVVITDLDPVVVPIDPTDAFFIGRQLLSWQRTGKPNPQTAAQLGRVGKLLLAAGRAHAATVTLGKVDAIGVGLSLEANARVYRRLDLGERLGRVGKAMYAAARAQVTAAANAEGTP